IPSDGSVWFLGTDNQTVYHLIAGQQPQATYKLADALVNIKNAGFSVGGESLKRSDDGTVSVSIAVPVGDAIVELQGFYNPKTNLWSIEGTYRGNIKFGWLVLSNPHFQLTNNYLEVDGIFSVYGIQPLANAHVKAQLYSNGIFTGTVDAHALQLGGFTLST